MAKKMKREDLPDAFAEGVRYTLEEGWVHWSDIEDPMLAAIYKNVYDRYLEYRYAVESFEEIIGGIAGE